MLSTVFAAFNCYVLQNLLLTPLIPVGHEDEHLKKERTCAIPNFVSPLTQSPKGFTYNSSILSVFFYAVSHFAIVRSAYIAFRKPTQDEVKSKDDDSCKTTLFCGPESKKEATMSK